MDLLEQRQERFDLAQKPVYVMSHAQINRPNRSTMGTIEDHELGANEYRGAGGPLRVSAGSFRYPLAEAMIEAGLLLGLSREVSTKLVVQTMLGTARLLRDEQMHPVELREAVTSPGGTTIRAIRELEQAGIRAAFLNAINAAMERLIRRFPEQYLWSYNRYKDV